ncbi:MAG: hypothetical protein Q9162_007310 [Coniocarpon cinnabarinum]
METFGAIVGIIDILARTTSKLHDLQKKVRGAASGIEVMVGELDATKEALYTLATKITVASSGTIHGESAKKLHPSLTACEHLVQAINTRVSNMTSTKSSAMLKSIRAVLINQETTELFEQLARILNAINIVISDLEEWVM